MVTINFEKGLSYCFKNGKNCKFSADRTIQTNHYSLYLLKTLLITLLYQLKGYK